MCDYQNPKPNQEIKKHCTLDKMHTYNCIDISTNSILFYERNNKINIYMMNLLPTKIIH
jgi:hypothetical protein